MTNPHKGDVPFMVGDKTYTLRFSHSALIKLEKSLNKGLFQIMSEISDAEHMRLGTIVSLLWAGLQKHHPGMTEDDTANLLDDMPGGASDAITSVDEAFRKAFNAPGTKGTNPPQAGNGTGMSNSLSTPVTVTTPTLSGTSRPEN
jgi:hypothetical protein